MLDNARRVLVDCRHSLNLLQEEVQPDTFRVLWVAGISLARAVGHVLQKVDSEQNGAVKVAVAAAYSSWKSDKPSNAIFWDFIEVERNQVLKQYELGFFNGAVDILLESQVYRLDDLLFCPIVYGSFAGEDCRDILEQAIYWWEHQLALIEANVIKAQ